MRHDLSSERVSHDVEHVGRSGTITALRCFSRILADPCRTLDSGFGMNAPRLSRIPACFSLVGPLGTGRACAEEGHQTYSSEAFGRWRTGVGI